MLFIQIQRRVMHIMHPLRLHIFLIKCDNFRLHVVCIGYTINVCKIHILKLHLKVPVKTQYFINTIRELFQYHTQLLTY